MTDTEEFGVCLFAYNTPEMDYIKMAVATANNIRAHMRSDLKICLITTEGDANFLYDIYDSDTVDFTFDDIVISDTSHRPNTRLHFDSPWTTFSSQFNNSNKHEIINLSPYEKTLLIDVDYIIQNGNLDYIFDTDESVVLYKNVTDLSDESPNAAELRLSTFGIPMRWSTVIYFDKSDFSKLFFDLWAHIAENYNFYQHRYGFVKGMFRTDFCVSIADHILSGFRDGNLIPEFADTPMRYMSQKDDIVCDMSDMDDIIFLVHNRQEPWKNVLTRIHGDNIHIMNKRAYLRLITTTLETFDDE